MSAPLVSLDIGCGALKRPGHVGLDVVASEGVDRVVDFDAEALPFGDGSVGAVFSSHCLEHLRDPVPLLREISRVCAHGARAQLWTPYSGHRDAFLFGHRSYFNEATYDHLGNAHWSRQLGARWIVHDVVFAIPGAIVEDLRAHAVDVAFAIRHLNNIVTEIGAFVEIDKSDLDHPREPPRWWWATSRAPEARVAFDRAGVASPPAWSAKLKSVLG